MDLLIMLECPLWQIVSACSVSLCSLALHISTSSKNNNERRNKRDVQEKERGEM